MKNSEGKGIDLDESRGLQERLEALKQLNRRRFDYVLARSRTSSVSAALDQIGMSSSWYYKFSEGERQQLEELADELHYEQEIQACLILVQAVNEAATVKVDGLKSKDRRIQQDAATEILDRVLGKPTQKQEISGPGGGPIEQKVIEVKPIDYRSAITPLAPGPMDDSAAPGESQNPGNGPEMG